MANFQARAATAEQIARLAGSFPANPFLTPEYADAQRLLGREAWLLSRTSTNSRENGCLAFVRSGRLGRSLTVPSTPSISAKSDFWSGFAHFLKEYGITELELQTFGSSHVAIPTQSGETERIPREEFHWDLRAPNLWDGLSTTHRRWIKKGTQNNLLVKNTRALGALQEHMFLTDSSLERRRQRGETVFAGDQMFDEFSALLQSGAGELRQALSADGSVLSSILLLRSEKGAYLISAGTSEGGRNIGASHFLVYETARTLTTEQGELFNLGGVRKQESGLRAYKAAFGATAVPLESVIATPGSRIRRSFVNGVRKVAGVLLNRS